MLELILEFAACREPWDDSSDLRLVSKRWRLLSFRGLCQSAGLPIICIRDSKKLIWNDGCGEVSLRFYEKNFPKRCPRRMTLTNPVLPIELKIQRYPTLAEFFLFRRIAYHIAAVTVEHQAVRYGYPFWLDIADDRLDFPLQLPNLRSFLVSWKNAIRDPHFIKFVDLIRTSSKRLNHVEYKFEYCTDSKA